MEKAVNVKYNIFSENVHSFKDSIRITQKTQSFTAKVKAKCCKDYFNASHKNNPNKRISAINNKVEDLEQLYFDNFDKIKLIYYQKIERQDSQSKKIIGTIQQPKLHSYYSTQSISTINSLSDEKLQNSVLKIKTDQNLIVKRNNLSNIPKETKYTSIMNDLKLNDKGVNFDTPKMKLSLRKYSKQKRSNQQSPIKSQYSNFMTAKNETLPKRHWENWQNEQIKLKSYGCQCLPNCLWVDKWMHLATKHNFRYIKQSLKTQINENSINQINKDLPRTQINSQFFADDRSKNSLKQVLLSYCRQSPSIGYVQGMNLVASVIVFHAKNIANSKAVFNLVMKERRFQAIYEGDLLVSSNLALHLKESLQKHEPQLQSHFVKNTIEIQFFARMWYFSMMASFVPLESMHFIIDKFLRKGFKGINEVFVTFLSHLKEELMSLNECELKERLSNDYLIKRSKDIDWLQIVGCSQNLNIYIFTA